MRIAADYPDDAEEEAFWLRGVDLNHRPLGYEPNELPDCSTPQFDHKQCPRHRQTRQRHKILLACAATSGMKEGSNCGNAFNNALFSRRSHLSAYPSHPAAGSRHRKD